MANQTITFNQPGIKIFMTDDCSFLDGMNSNTLTVDIRNTGENYIVLPGMFRVTDKNGNHPSGSTTNGTYFTESQANAAKSAMINSVYDGNEYTTVQDQYRSMLTSGNSSIWNNLGVEEPMQAIVFNSKGDYYFQYSTKDFNSNYTDWPSSINSDGLWFTGYDGSSGGAGYICQKVNDWDTYAYDYSVFMGSEFLYGDGEYGFGDTLSAMSEYHLSSSDLYSIMSSWGAASSSKPMLGLAYIGYGQTTTENVGTSVIYNSGVIGSSSIRFNNIQFRYNGAAPSQIFYSQNGDGALSEEWRVIKAIANARTDQGSGNTESVIIVEKLQ